MKDAARAFGTQQEPQGKCLPDNVTQEQVATLIILVSEERSLDQTCRTSNRSFDSTIGRSSMAIIASQYDQGVNWAPIQ